MEKKNLQMQPFTSEDHPGIYFIVYTCPLIRSEQLKMNIQKILKQQIPMESRIDENGDCLLHFTLIKEHYQILCAANSFLKSKRSSQFN